MKPRSNPDGELMWKKRLQKSGNFLAILALNVTLFLLLSTAVIWHLVAPREDEPMTFVKVKVTPVPKTPPPAHGGESAKTHLDPTLTVKPPTTSVTSVVVSPNSTSSFTMPSMDVPVSTMDLPSLTQPSGTGLSDKSGSGDAGIIHSNPFGNAVQDGVSGLIGELYDLKQTPDGTPTPLAVQPPEDDHTLYSAWGKLPVTKANIDVIKEYVRTWNQDILDKYYKSPVSLQMTQLFIPTRASEEATKAFGVADKVLAKRWVIHYHGNIVPPKSGRFRFLGFGDDFLLVRLGTQNVLDGSFPGESVDPSADTKDEGIPGRAGGTSAAYDMRCGRWFDLEQGAATPIDILIGEGPGGVSGFYLFIEEEGDTSAKGDYPVFQTAATQLPAVSGLLSPDFTGKTMVFATQ